MNDPTGQAQATSRGGVQPPLAELTDRELLEQDLFPLWCEWADAIAKNAAAAQYPAEVFTELTGATVKSPAALMFAAFCGGVIAGVQAAITTEG